MPDPSSFAASSQNRSLAYLVDLIAASLLFGVAAIATDLLGSSHSLGMVEFSVVLFAYHACFLLQKDGVSFGKYLRNICVVSASGGKLLPSQCLLRAACIALPWACLASEDFLDALPDLLWDLLPVPSAAVAVLGTMWLFADILILEFTVARRTLTDRLARTLVLNLPPLQPHRAPAVPMYSANDAEFGTPPRRPPQER
jgi:uncharacterized RDD family membrane protein YckC